MIQAYVEDRQIRNDGMLYANARPARPGIILSFESKHGPLSYPCDTFNDWQANLRAIAMSLEHLRAVDRYGVTKRGEQYAGWKSLPAPSTGPGDEIRNAHDARAPLSRILGGRVGSLPLDAAIREAEMATHPDRGGHPDDFKRVQAARVFLIG